MRLSLKDSSFDSIGETFRQHWPEYLMEAAGLMFFMVNAAWITTVLEYPGSPIRHAIQSDFLRRIPLGIAMGFVIAVIVYNPWGKRSGAHINPAITWAFLRLGKIGKWDAAFYTLFQFIGAICAGFTMRLLLGAPFQSAKVMFATTRPGPSTGPFIAFAAEFLITFFLVFVMLLAMSSRKWETKVGWIAAFLIMVYLWFETPLSGMSLNPARTFGSALAGNVWDSLWVYFTAPPIAALLAAEIFLRWRTTSNLLSARLAGNTLAGSFLDNIQRLPEFPLIKEGAAPLFSEESRPKPTATV